MVELCFKDGRASEATTWVCTAPGLSLPFFQEALDDALKKGVCIGLHKESFSILVHFPEPQSSKDVRCKLQAILRQGGASKQCLDSIEAFDNFHAESWGMVTLSGPNIPQYADVVVEEDELSDTDAEECAAVAEEPKAVAEEPETIAEELTTQAVPAQPDLFALVVKRVPQEILIPSVNKCLDMDTVDQRQFRKALVEAGGPLTEYVKEIFFPRNKAHVQQVQNEHRALAAVRPVFFNIMWLSDAPISMNVYTKPNMGLRRRLQWIEWKASNLNLVLNPVTFMALFKQVSCYDNEKSRMNSYKEAMKQWQGTFNWKELGAETRQLIHQINVGNMDCYCLSCRRVLNHESASKFCCRGCALQFCPCGAKFESRLINDVDKMQQNLEGLGPHHVLHELAEMLCHKKVIESFKCPGDIHAKFDELTQRRLSEKCCEAVDGYMDKKWCQKCINDFSYLNKIQRYIRKLHHGELTWGHCEVIVARHKALLANVPTKWELFCKKCEASRKRQQV
jgi:hypothetical protein